MLVCILESILKYLFDKNGENNKILRNRNLGRGLSYHEDLRTSPNVGR